MKMFLWVLLGFLVTGLGFWILTLQGVPRNPLLTLLVVVIFVVSPVGSFWMLYMLIRHEKLPLPMVLLAFIPYTFLWYYFECVRPQTTGLRAAPPQPWYKNSCIQNALLKGAASAGIDATG